MPGTSGPATTSAPSRGAPASSPRDRRRRRRCRWRRRAPSREASARRRRRASWRDRCRRRAPPRRRPAAGSPSSALSSAASERADEQRMALVQPQRRMSRHIAFVRARRRRRQGDGTARANSMPPSRTTATLPRARPRRNIALKSRHGSRDQRAFDRVVAAQIASAQSACVSSDVGPRRSAGAFRAPSSSTIVRSMPGKRENGSVALDVGDADPPQERIERGPGGMRRRSRSCVRRRSSMASDESRRA